jgi:hypothetical protein
MIKLKDILLESINDKIKIVTTTDVLDIILNPDFLTLFRGCNIEIQGISDKKFIRKDRNPKTTKKSLDIVVESIRRIFFENKPSRREVLFCSTNYENSKYYGIPYTVLPSKKCKLYYSNTTDYSHRMDSFEAISGIDFYYLDMYFKEFIESKPKRNNMLLLYIKKVLPNLKDFISVKISNSHDQSYEIIKKFIGPDFNSFTKSLKSIETNKDFGHVEMRLIHQLSALAFALEKIYKYWENITEITNSSEIFPDSEIQVYGDYVYLIEPSLYDSYRKEMVN